MLTTITEDYFTQQHALCCKHLVRYGQKASAEELHKVRVSIKKIKALLHMLRDSCGIDMEAFFSGYRAIFREAGHIRSATLIAERLGQISTHKKAINHRTHHISVLHRKLSEDIPMYINDINERVEDLMAEIRACQPELPEYIDTLHKKLRKKWRKTTSETNYHTLRKHLKQLFYSASLLEEAELKKIISSRDLKAIDKLQDLIGQWHDAIDMSARIFSDVADAARVEQTIHREAKQLRKKIIKAGDKLWR